MKRRIYALLAGLGLLPVLVAALALGGNTAVSVTSTATTVTLAKESSALTIINDTASANELYVDVFSCGETVVAAVATTAAIRLEPGEFANLTHGSTEPGRGYCGLSIITTAAETATARYTAK